MPNEQTIRVRVLLFAHLRDIGGPELDLEMKAGCRSLASAALDRLSEMHPRMAAALPSARVAINGDWAQREDPLSDGDELAIIPPVSGG